MNIQKIIKNKYKFIKINNQQRILTQIFLYQLFKVLEPTRQKNLFLATNKLKQQGIGT